MPLSENDKNEVKQMVLGSLEHLFSDLTEKYNSVRFGKRDLTPREREEVENWLETFKAKS